MAIAFDAATNNYTASATTTYTTSHTCTGSNLILIVGTMNGFVTASGVTYNGVSMTKLADSTQVGQTMTLWYLINPATGTNNVVTSFTGTQDWQVLSASYTGVKQTGFPDASDATQTSSGSGITFNLTTVADNSWIFSMIRGNLDGPATASTNVTDRSSGTRYFSAGDTNAAQTPAGSKSMAWTQPRAQTNWGIIASFAPFTTSAANGNFLELL